MVGSRAGVLRAAQALAFLTLTLRIAHLPPMLPPGPEFDRLYEATYPRILRTLATMLGDVAAAEDCAQDAFLKAFRAWHSWKQDAPVEAWLHRIAINVAISYRRKRALREVGELVRRLGMPEQPDPTDQAIGGDLLHELRRLPPRQAAALVLRHLHGYSNREIAAALGVPESTVATRLMIAKRTLRARLGDAGRAISDTSAPWRVPPVE
jgi:RNA polymerase sigma-70 factor, ECF subfamily